MQPVLFQWMQTLQEQGRDFVLATLVNVIGSAPQEPGARAIISRKGLEYGTVGGGKIEAQVIRTAQELLADSRRKNGFFQWNLQKDIGMTCGGVVSFFLEVYRPERTWKVAVFGAGHVAQELVRLLILLDCDVTCVDFRPDWIDKLPKSSNLTVHCAESAEKMKDWVRHLHSDAFLTTMTQGHSTDLPVLIEALLNHSFPYVGAIGSETKARVLRKDLRNAGVSDSALTAFHCPIGEDFGNNTPIEIAFSIVAQLIRKRDRFFSQECLTQV